MSNPLRLQGVPEGAAIRLQSPENSAIRLRAVSSLRGPKGDPGTSVPSVFGRTGAIVAENNDYSADQVDNDSSVTGDTVKDALEQLASDVAGAGDVDSVNGQTGVVVLDPDDLDDTGTTNKFTDAADISKLAGIEALADVTDAGNVGSAIHGATGKTTPVDADETALIDSAASNVLKKVTWANIKATLKSYFDGIYQAVGSYAASGANTDITSLAGTATNNDAAAGKIGEIIQSDIPAGSAVSLASTSSANITSISLTAGDWNVYGAQTILPDASTQISRVNGCISQSSTTFGTNPDARFGTTFETGQKVAYAVPSQRISLASTTTIYLVANAIFTVSTCTAYGRLWARRAR